MGGRAAISNYLVSLDLSDAQKLACAKFRKYVQHDVVELASLLAADNTIYSFVDRLAVIRFRVFSVEDSLKIHQYLRVMYPKSGVLSPLLPQLSINGKYVKNIIKKQYPELSLKIGQVVKIYTQIKKEWDVCARVLVAE